MPRASSSLLAAFGEPVLIVSLVVAVRARAGSLHAWATAARTRAIAAFEVALAWALSTRPAPSSCRAGAPLPFAQLAAAHAVRRPAARSPTSTCARGRSRPAIAEARIQALQARIRPHFLYNSINAVLSLIRSDPRRAERALEDLADLFRVLMADNRTLAPDRQRGRARAPVPGDRGAAPGRPAAGRAGASTACPPMRCVPPLVLQPLVENAVYHGIEPSHRGGEIAIDVARRRRAARMMTLTNPLPAGRRQRARQPDGASPTSASACSCTSTPRPACAPRSKDGIYRVTIRMPYLTAAA